MKTLENFPANNELTHQREAVIRSLVQTASVHGFAPLEVDDGDVTLRTNSVEDVLDVVFSVNLSTLRFTGHGGIHEVEVDLTQAPNEILVDSSGHPKWETCLAKFVDFRKAPQGIKYVIDSDSSGYFCDEDGTVLMSFVTLVNSDQQRNMEANAQRFVSGYNSLGQAFQPK